MGTNLDVIPSDVDLTQMRRFLHTPKDGIQLPQDTKYYQEQFACNEFLRTFFDDYDNTLQPKIEKEVKPNHVSGVKKYLVTHSPIRQAKKNLAIMAKQEKARLGSVVKKSPTKHLEDGGSPVRQQTLPEPDALGRIESIMTQHSGDEYQAPPPVKLFKYIDPKKETFSNQLRNDTQYQIDKSKNRLARTRQYNQMVNVTHLKQR